MKPLQFIRLENIRVVKTFLHGVFCLLKLMFLRLVCLLLLIIIIMCCYCFCVPLITIRPTFFVPHLIAFRSPTNSYVIDGSLQQRTNFIPSMGSFICIDHFTSVDYMFSDSKKLKVRSVSSVFNFPLHLQQNSSKNEKHLLTVFPQAMMLKSKLILETNLPQKRIY